MSNFSVKCQLIPIDKIPIDKIYNTFIDLNFIDFFNDFKMNHPHSMDAFIQFVEQSKDKKISQSNYFVNTLFIVIVYTN